MDENVVAALVGAGSAIIVSIITVIINLFISRKGVKTETITKNRVLWIKEVRELTMKFLDIYTNNSLTRVKDLRKIKNKISLYIRDGIDSYKDFADAMEQCINTECNETDLNNLISCAQYTFYEVWIRAKREAGIPKIEDRKFERECKKAYIKYQSKKASKI